MGRIGIMKKIPQQMFQLACVALERAGANPVMAAAAARHLVLAEEQGLPTHGMSRVPFYVSMLKNGRADGAARPRLIADHAAVCLIDNADGLPFESCELAIAEVIARARRSGIAFAGVRNSGHAGVLGIHLQAIASAGMVGIGFTNTPAAMPAWGGKRPLFGTNPGAFAFPRNNADPVVIDLALTTVVRGKIMLAAQKGERIPEGWALDRHGKPTTDPKEAIEHGSMFPVGGAKGAMLALAVELICVSLTGAALGTEADSFFSEQGNRPRTGQAFLAIDPGALGGTACYAERVEALVTSMLDDPGVRLPGARRFESQRQSRTEGVEIAADLLAKIETLARG